MHSRMVIGSHDEAEAGTAGRDTRVKVFSVATELPHHG